MQKRDDREQYVHASACSHYVGYFLSVFLKPFDQLFSCDTIHPIDTQTPWSPVASQNHLSFQNKVLRLRVAISI